MPNLFIMRGLPGSGKSTLIRKITHNAVICSADDYFIGPDGVYRFVPSRLPDAHAYCREAFESALEQGTHDIVIDNTNVRVDHFMPYVSAGRAGGYVVVIVNIFDGGCTDAELAARNAHGVPLHSIQRMRRQYQH